MMYLSLKTYIARIYTFLIVLLLGVNHVFGINSVTNSVSDSVISPGLIFRSGILSNSKGDRTDIGFDLISTVPLIVYKAEWINNDSVKQPLEPFYLDANVTEEEGKATLCHAARAVEVQQSSGEEMIRIRLSTPRYGGSRMRS